MNDSLIGAYIDGELDAEKRALVEHWLASDAGAAARYERLKMTNSLIQRAIPRVATPPHDPLAAMILGEAAPVQRPPRWSTNSAWALRAAALAAACVIGVFAGLTAGGSPQHSLAWTLSPEVARIIDTAPSGVATRVRGGEVTVAMTILSDAGEVCRQFRINSDSSATDSLACRAGDGWRPLMQVAVENSNGDYVPATGDTPLDAALATLGPARSLDNQEESQLMRRRWRPSAE